MATSQMTRSGHQPGRIGEELRRLATRSERHRRRLLARIFVALRLSVVVDLVGAMLAWELEKGVKGSELHRFGDAFSFVSVQLLTVSLSL